MKQHGLQWVGWHLALYCRALDFECGRVCGISRYTDENKPFFIRSHLIVDYLGASKGRMVVKYFLRWCLVTLVWNRPMIHRCFCDHADGGVRYPLPSDTHFQNMMSSLLPCDLIFCLVSMLKICKERAANDNINNASHENMAQCDIPLRTRTFCLGCMIAESADIGCRSTLLASVRSMMTTWACSLDK